MSCSSFSERCTLQGHTFFHKTNALAGLLDYDVNLERQQWRVVVKLHDLAGFCIGHIYESKGMDRLDIGSNNKSVLHWVLNLW